MTLQWTSTMSGNETRIFRGKLIAGLIKRSTWKDDAQGELNGYMIRFKTTGFWNPTTKILDIEGTRELGHIKYNSWKTTAVITYENQSYDWSFDSWMRKTWNVKNGENHARYSKTSFWKNKGEIEAENISPAIILTGLFVYSYFQKMAAAASGYA
ncbi:hypothetical protein [Dyadobacter sp. CY356]|uniref:hypothetical protein n=1 Tax=Dyadobacter sp. CY356 TaxID=2906442 RepID=UPI001F1D59CE|nr:hypothetical protein [Dyadobacter sp. CY356]MCF0059595.1 hypothetical protein [Dyadobacter sp. CY356]